MDQCNDAIEERVPQVLRGEGSNLDPFRSEKTFADILSQVTGDDETALIPQSIPVKATWQQTQNDESSTVFSHEAGFLFVTSERIFFISTSDKNHDVSVDAACIQLHAVSEDGIYIQIQESNENSDGGIEWTVTPTTTTPTTTNTEEEEACQVLFEALSKLVSMHPTVLDDDDDGFGDDAIFAPPSTGEATEQERLAMLERLDNMLEVPPEYQVQAEGQFDDAESEEQEDGDDLL